MNCHYKCFVLKISVISDAAAAFAVAGSHDSHGEFPYNFTFPLRECHFAPITFSFFHLILICLPPHKYQNRNGLCVPYHRSFNCENIFGNPPLTSGCMDFIIVCTKKFSALEAIACHHQQTSTERTRKTTMFIGKKRNTKAAISVSQFMILLILISLFHHFYLCSVFSRYEYNCD